MRISFEDLNHISIECRSCKTETVIDLSSRDYFTSLDSIGNRQVKWRAERLSCPVCQNAFESSFTTAMKHLLGMIDAIQDSKEKVSFQIPTDAHLEQMLRKP